MKEWQFDVLFVVGVFGTLLLLVAPAIPGLEGIPQNTLAVGGIGTIMAYVLTQKKSITKKPEDKSPDVSPKEGGDEQ